MMTCIDKFYPAGWFAFFQDENFLTYAYWPDNSTLSGHHGLDWTRKAEERVLWQWTAKRWLSIEDWGHHGYIDIYPWSMSNLMFYHLRLWLIQWHNCSVLVITYQILYSKFQLRESLCRRFHSFWKILSTI